MLWAVIFLLLAFAFGILTFGQAGSVHLWLSILFVGSIVGFLIAFIRSLSRFATEGMHNSIKLTTDRSYGYTADSHDQGR